MNATETLAANEAIWSHYLQSHARSWIDPLGLFARSSAGREVLDANAASIAGFLSAIAAGPFARLYDDRGSLASADVTVPT